MNKLLLLTYVICVLLFQGCSKFTYPSPQPVEISHYMHASTIKSDRNNPFYGFEAMCPSIIRGATHDVVTFNIDKKIGFCFASPVTGSYKSLNYPELVFKFPCVRGSIGGFRGESSALVFQVYVGGKDVVLGFDQTLGMLEVNERSLTVKPQIQYKQFEDMPPGISVDGELRWDVNGSLHSYVEALPFFLHPGYMLEFNFNQKCDPDSHYRLTITGITSNSSAILVHPVDFFPYGEFLSKFD